MFEIERRFLVQDVNWGVAQRTRRIEQGYVFSTPERNLRIRRSDHDYILTLKVKAEGISRHEIETHIKAGQGQYMLDHLCVTPIISKTRHEIIFAEKLWEVDVFDKDNAGLVIAEIELNSQDESFSMPPWTGPEVTNINRFFNVSLAQMPFAKWGVTYQELLENPMILGSSA